MDIINYMSREYSTTTSTHGVFFYLSVEMISLSIFDVPHSLTSPKFTNIVYRPD